MWHCEIRDPQSEREPVPPAMAAQSLNYWAASEVSKFLILVSSNLSIFFLLRIKLLV